MSSKDGSVLVVYQRARARRSAVSRSETRLWLAALSRLVHRRRWAAVFPVTPSEAVSLPDQQVADLGKQTHRQQEGDPDT
jgi:hypothetical protein